MIAIISLLIVVFLSIVITRIASIALTHTGLTKEAAKFQARSAFSGAGFTTNESEMVVSHPVRRKIVMFLILIGNAGIVAAISSLILTFVKTGSTTTLTLRVSILTAGIVGLWSFASSKWVDQKLSILVDKMLKRYTRLEIRDYASLLHLTGEYRLAELRVRSNDWIKDRSLEESKLRSEGINLLGIRKPDGSYLGNPRPDTRIRHKDCLVIYGRIEAIEELDQRKTGLRGDFEHQEAVKEQKQVVSREEKREEVKKPKENS